MFPYPDFSSWSLFATITYPHQEGLVTNFRTPPHNAPVVQEYSIQGQVIAVLAASSEEILYWHFPLETELNVRDVCERTEDDDPTSFEELPSVKCIVPHLCRAFELSFDEGLRLMLGWLEHSLDEMAEIQKQFSIHRLH